MPAGLQKLPDGRYWKSGGPGDVPSSGNIVDIGSFLNSSGASSTNVGSIGGGGSSFVGSAIDNMMPSSIPPTSAALIAAGFPGDFLTNSSLLKSSLCLNICYKTCAHFF